MNIVFLLTQDLDSPSGLGRYYPLARELAALGHQVVIHALHSNYRSLGQKSFVEGNLRVRYAAQMHVLKQGSRKSYYGPLTLLWVSARATLALTAAALHERPDILWAGKPHPMNGFAWVIGRLRWGCRLFLDCDDDETGSGNFAAGWQRRLVGWFERRLPKIADLVTTNTHHTRDALLRLGVPAERVVYLSNGVDASRFATPPDPGEVETLRAGLDLAGKKVIGYIGSLSLASHAVDLLIAAFEILSEEIPQSRLLLVGGGEDFERLRGMAAEKKMAERVIFTGRVPADKVQAYYRLMDVSVDPVKDNAAARGRSPLKLFEAWQNRIPMVTSAVGERGLLASADAGVLFVAPGSAEALAGGLIAAIQDEPLRTRLVTRGEELCQKYSWRQLASDLDAALFSNPGQPRPTGEGQEPPVEMQP